MSNDRFIFKGHTWDDKTGVATFSYELHHNEEIFTFSEQLIFPDSETREKVPHALLTSLFNNVLVALGVSYYKLFCPRQIQIENFALTHEQADFWNTVYTKGLGEFFYQNNLDFRGLVAFPFSDTAKAVSTAFPRENRSLVGIGGGKDSIVTVELLKKHEKPFTSFVINNHTIRENVIELIGGPSLTIKRVLDSHLFELTKRPDAYNGHVPVSSHYAFIGLLSAALYNYRFIIVSNEESSNYGNVLFHGSEVNHQWSKSFEFEQLFQNYVRTFITPDIHYFSLLRQFTELKIVKQFVNYPQYFAHFSSCNRNFKITGEGLGKKWCGECPKCAFAFAMLAAFLPKEQVLTIFGQNLFVKEGLLQTYKELLGVSEIKPFDCVGTPDEVQIAFYLATQYGYENDPVMQFFKQHVLPKIADIDQLSKEVFRLAPEHSIPEEFQEIISL